MANNTKEKLLDTAIELFWLESLGSVSVDDICKAAGVKKGSFYHYFQSKTDLTIEAFGKLWDDCQARLDNAFSSSYKPLERLKNYCDLVYESQLEKFQQTGKVLGCPFASCGMEACTREERIRLKVTDIYDRYTSYLEKMLDDARAEGMPGVTDPAVMAEEMVSYVIGVTHQAKMKNDLEILRRDLFPGLIRYLSPGGAYKITQVKSHGAHTAAMLELT